ncbi:hypothetical protein F4781DRAFT_424350 [Annulohypoxylon bovei var. microspora]|nr:hypothetical protein F4781DRAFT_424350 [Annulohypoxylon bovei var. microspora]
MASKRDLQRKMLSFGVELEFYIFVTQDKSSTFRPLGFESHPGNPLIVDGRIDSEEIRKDLALRINNLLRDAPVATVLSKNNRDIDIEGDEEWNHLRPYRIWQVKDEISMQDLPIELARLNNERSEWVAVEVVSPALWATDEGFDQVRRVCEFLQNTFLTSTLTECGLHIHVGQGNNWLPITLLRRMAAFLYAADPILAQSHPVYRRNDTLYCLSTRLYSNVTLGMKNSHAPEQPSQVDELQEISLVAPRGWKGLAGNVARLSRPMNSYSRTEDNFPPRPNTPSYIADPIYIESTLGDLKRSFGINQNLRDFSPTPMLEAVAEILQTTNRRNLSILLGSHINRSAYSFQQLSWERKRTIEFRQPTGTVDPAEVVSQARIAVRLCEFAATATHEEFQKMILDFASADEDPSWFDVYDLLIELGLRPEARIVHAALTGTMSNSIRDRYFESRRYERL